MRSVSHRKSRTGHALPNSSPARHRTLKSTYKHFVLTPFLPRHAGPTQLVSPHALYCLPPVRPHLPYGLHPTCSPHHVLLRPILNWRPLVHYTVPLLRDRTRSTCSGTCPMVSTLPVCVRATLFHDHCAPHSHSMMASPCSNGAVL